MDAEVLKIRYTTAGGYRIVPASGVWGGITPQAQILANFFIDTFAVPDSTEYEITPDGGLGPEISKSYDDDARTYRRLEVGVLLDYRSARTVATWLMAQADELERLEQTSEVQDVSSSTSNEQ